MSMAASRSQLQSASSRSLSGMVGPSTNSQPDSNTAMFSKDVEDEANSHFVKIYNQSPTDSAIVEFLEMMKRFKESENKRERVSLHFDLFSLLLPSYSLYVCTV